MSTFASVPSPIESLIGGSIGVWDGLRDVCPASQIADRRELRARLDRPIDWSCTEHTIELYQSLNRLLSSDNDRFILYCPVSLIPNVDLYRKYDEAIDTFCELYVEGWRRLLHVHDVRANFADGDVPDIELNVRPMERVVQAAYLAPTLISKGLILSRQLDMIGSDDEILSKSLDQALGRRSNQPKQVVMLDARQTSQGRLDWLRWERRRNTTEAMGQLMGSMILAGEVPDLEPLKLPGIVIVGIGSAIEQAILRDDDRIRASELYRQFEPELLEFAQRQDSRDYISRVFCRLYSLGVVGKDKLDELGIFFPNLNGPLFENLSVIEDDRKRVRDILRDQELTSVIYPVAVVFGSRLKGYGSPDADTDLAVFVRPGVQDSDHVSQLLRSKFGQEVVQYWLDEDGENLCVHDFPKLKANIGDSTNCHVLFGGAWEGDTDSMSMLCDKLLVPYVRNTDSDCRRLWLEEMERDILQYRLLHRGYERFFVPRTKDVFWDEGYRLTAAKLYASHVFMPMI